MKNGTAGWVKILSRMYKEFPKLSNKKTSKSL
jgi:hypothetical protein